MLLESALADFSTDESDVFEDAQVGVGSEWGSLPNSKSNSPLTGGGVSQSSDAAVGPAEIKHVYLDQKAPPRRLFSVLSESPVLSAAPAPQQPRRLSDFLGMTTSRSPPAVDVNCGPIFEISPADDEMPVTGKEGYPGRGKNLNRGHLKSGGDDKILLHQRMSFTEDAGPFAWEAQRVIPKLQRGSSNYQAKQLQIPPGRVIPTFNKNGKGVSTSSAQSHTKEYWKEQPLQRQGVWQSSVPKPNERVKPVYQSTKSLPSGGAKKFKRTDLFKSPPPVPRLETHYDRSDAANNYDESMNSEYKYYEEESPVSILQRPASPPATNSSGSSGSSVHSPPIAALGKGAAAAAPLPGVALPRRRLPSFSSSSAHDSPRASTSSSTRYMGQCLVALQAALAIDPEKSKRYEDSFVELDTYVEGEESRVYAKSEQFDDEDDDEDDEVVVRNEQGASSSRGWAERGSAAAAAQSELEPEYNTVDFYTDSEEEEQFHDRRSNLSSSRASSLARSSSGSSISRPLRRSLNTQVSVENYSLKDKRFLSSHPSSWVDDSVSSSLTNSQCNTLTRHQECSWDDQQADLYSVRAEEVVRGAIDGLRFTYSPVSSAFVFSRSNEGDEEAAGSGRKIGYSYHHHGSQHHKTITDSEASRRFSINLDYETSIRSEDSMSFARGSDVTELGASRAESWSKVARGIAFQQAQQGYAEAVPSSFLRRAGNAMMFEDQGNGSGSNQSVGLNPGGGGPAEGTDSRLVTKRPTKKSGITTCLPFRSILRNFKTIGSPGRSRLGMTQSDRDRQLHWPTPAPAVSRLTY